MAGEDKSVPDFACRRKIEFLKLPAAKVSSAAVYNFETFQHVLMTFLYIYLSRVLLKPHVAQATSNKNGRAPQPFIGGKRVGAGFYLSREGREGRLDAREVEEGRRVTRPERAAARREEVRKRRAWCSVEG